MALNPRSYAVGAMVVPSEPFVHPPEHSNQGGLQLGRVDIREGNTTLEKKHNAIPCAFAYGGGCLYCLSGDVLWASVQALCLVTFHFLAPKALVWTFHFLVDFSFPCGLFISLLLGSSLPLAFCEARTGRRCTLEAHARCVLVCFRYSYFVCIYSVLHRSNRLLR